MEELSSKNYKVPGQSGKMIVSKAQAGKGDNDDNILL
jgi:hypothetical protein